MSVLDGSEESLPTLNLDDVKVRIYKASGKGGQHRNKVESAVELTHKPTGIKALCASERCQHTNKKKAFINLEGKLDKYYSHQARESVNKERQSQIGTGMRGDKVQTVQEQNGHVINHVTGKKVKLKKYLKGDIDLLH